MSEPAREATRNFFRQQFGLDERSLTTALDTALERRLDYADLFFEYTSQDSILLEEGIVKSGDRHVAQGVGVRAQCGERQGYAHSDDVTVESVRLAASTARAIAQEDGGGGCAAVRAGAHDARNLYPVALPPTEAPVGRKVEIVERIDSYARRLDPRVKQVMASCVTQHRQILIAGSDGALTSDARPLVRLDVRVIAESADGARREAGYQGMGGRFEFERLLAPDAWRPLVEEAVRIATLNLETLEGDFNRKKTSAFSDRLGARVAAECVSVVDDGTLPERRGSLNVDDEGTPTQRTTLIENGVLRGYLHDRLNAKLMGMAPTGNGRRESYAHLPMPRMTNTFMLPGEDDPQDIIRSVDRGIYAVSFGGGQVDITSGKFVFTANEAYRIEAGRIGAPLKGATLIGNGPDVLTRVSLVGNDLALDRGVGTCGKDGQSVPVGVGLPTIRVDELTVGGTQG
jgi:TldD protein